MSKRGLTKKSIDEHHIVLERPMVTRHYHMEWDLDKCVGCQIGPLCCPKDAIHHVEAKLDNGRIVEKPSVDIDADACVFCGICEIMCPKNAIEITINDKHENPVIAKEEFAVPMESTIFDKTVFDWSREDFVVTNCPTSVIHFDFSENTLFVDDENCIRCRQCEIASNGSFKVTQPWQGNVTLKGDLCVEGCLACADICPTRALSINDNHELVLADYYCIKCGACMQVCPVKAVTEEYTITTEAYGVTKEIKHQKVSNIEQLPIWVERWRYRHKPVESGTWVEAIQKLADEKAGMMEIDSKRALKRRDLLTALVGSKLLLKKEE